MTHRTVTSDKSFQSCRVPALKRYIGYMESYKLNLLRKMLACDALVELVLNELKKVSGELEKLICTENITQEDKKKFRIC